MTGLVSSDELLSQCGFYWTSTTHISTVNASDAVYIVFGKGMGYMEEYGGWIDVHGAGSQRSDPKVATKAETASDGASNASQQGAQHDAIRINNMVRCVRG